RAARRIHVQVGASAVGVEGAAPDEGAAGRPKLDPVAGGDVGDGMRALERGGGDAWEHNLLRPPASGGPRDRGQPAQQRGGAARAGGGGGGGGGVGGGWGGVGGGGPPGGGVIGGGGAPPLVRDGGFGVGEGGMGGEEPPLEAAHEDAPPLTPLRPVDRRQH